MAAYRGENPLVTNNYFDGILCDNDPKRKGEHSTRARIVIKTSQLQIITWMVFCFIALNFLGRMYKGMCAKFTVLRAFLLKIGVRTA